MNLLFINKEFEKLGKIEDCINYKFEPRYKIKNGKRHIYFNDLKNDFEEEINTYGFSPFIQDTYNNQKRDKNIMSYKKNYINKGLTNYIKKKNHGIKEKEDTERPLIKPNITRSFKKIKENNPISLIKPMDASNNKDGNFLKKALYNLAKNKLNNSSQEFQFIDEDEEQASTKHSRKGSQLSQIFRLSMMKSTFLESIGLKSHPTRCTSGRNIKSADTPLLNVEKYLIYVSANKNKEIKSKKVIRLVNSRNIANFENKADLSDNIAKNITNGRKISENDIKPFAIPNSLQLNKGENAPYVFKSFKKYLTKDHLNSKNFKSFGSRLIKERFTGTDGPHTPKESFKILSPKIFYNHTLEKEKKFKDSEGKIFKSRNSLIKKFSNII